jgi:hypothetical protein
MAENATEHTYDAMWDILEFFYGSPKEHEKQKLEKFMNMPPIKTFNANTISLLYASLTEHWAILQNNLGKRFHSEDNSLFYPFLKKLPIAEVKNYKDMCTVMKLRRTFPTFRDWLGSQWDIYKDVKAGPADKGLTYWQQDKEEELASHSFFEQAIEKPAGIDVTVNSNDVSIRYDDMGEPVAYYEPGDDVTYMMYKNGKAHRIDKIKIPASTVRGAIGKGEERTFQPKKMVQFRKNENKKKEGHCIFCDKPGHTLYLCKQFAETNLKKRLSLVKEQQLCFRCLNQGHLANRCRVKFVCDINGCGKRHHRLLHTDEPGKSYYSHLRGQGIDSDIDSSESED